MTAQVSRAARLGLAAFVCVGLAAAAHAQKTHTLNGSGATIPDFGNASAYPLTINTGTLPASIGEVKVRLNGLTHSYLEDLQIVLVAPSGAAVTLMDRVGGYSYGVENADYLFVSDGAPFPWNSIPSSGRYLPGDNTYFNDDMPAPAPAGPYASTLNAFVPALPGGTWSLYITDRAGGDSGSIAGWSIVITESESVANPAYLDIPSAGPASLYPTTVVVDGLPSKVENVEVLLVNLAHQWMYDVEILLVGPTGQTCLLSSDCGGTHVTGIDLLFTDAAPDRLYSGVLATTGVYRPSECSATSFVAPAPAPPYGTTLSVFNGSDPNGVWKLYIFDDSGSDYGHMDGGWAMIVNGELCPADFNRSGTVSVQDIFDYLAAYFAGCP
jgi:subtilisin-like proprotein convertase family protein